MMNNRKEAVIGCLAAASIGAMWTGIQVYYGAKAAAKIANRMEPKFFFASDGFFIENLDINIYKSIPTIVENTPSIEKVILIPTRNETLSKGISHIRNSCYLSDFLETGKELNGSIPDIVFEQLPFDHPLFLICTSGTTGLPKAPVHGAGNQRTKQTYCKTSLPWNSNDTQLNTGEGIWSTPAAMHVQRFVSPMLPD
ncbi:acetoacetyl-CoA synthetase [Trichonephila clavipes]|nr:acetoacetyl-CoA synthetase [Trichonephila clavipes]